MTTSRPAGPVLTVIVAGLSRALDEVPVLGLLAIAIVLIAHAPDATMTQTIVGDVVSGLLGYMQGAKSNRNAPPPPPPAP